MRPQGSPRQLEKRRRQAIRLLKEQEPAGPGNLSAVARQLGVHRSSVLRWHRACRQHGPKGLRGRPNTGRPARLSPEQKARLCEILTQGPLALGYPTDLWTQKRIAQVIRRMFRVRYHPNHVWHLLRAMGWSCQKPQKRARQRNEAAIRHWKRWVWPHIKKGRKASGPPGFSG